MLSINTNISSLIAQSSMKSATSLLNQAIERMTTGYKINHAKDNAANYSIATNMTTKINSYMVAEDNCAMGLDMLNTANGTLDQISDKLTRLRNLQTQASNGTYGEASLNAINSEANALVDEINRLYSTAEYNGRKLFETDATQPIATYTLTRAVTVDDTMRVANVSSFTNGNTYYISNSDDLVALQNLVADGATTSNVNFVLTDDIDMSGVSFAGIGTDSNAFQGVFDGDGHIISNLAINNTSANGLGLFCYTESATIQNLGLEDVNIFGNNFVGALVGYAENGVTTIENCYSTGNVKGTFFVGGLVGYLNGNIANSYSSCTVSGNGSGGYLGGLVGSVIDVNINQSYATGNVGETGDTVVGGIIGVIGQDSDVSINNTYFTGNLAGDDLGGIVGSEGVGPDSLTGSNNMYNSANGVSAISDGPSTGFTLTSTAKTVSEIKSSLTSLGYTATNGWTIVNGEPILAWQVNRNSASNGGATTGGNAGFANGIVTLQIGTSSDSNSQIGFEITFSIAGVDDLRMIGLDTTTDYLTQLDEMLATVNAKQTEFGAVENRLNSALDEISIQYENLVSSRSTIRDADIAEVSATYIQQQILQQAAATLMATANQSPSIALQLI